MLLESTYNVVLFDTFCKVRNLKSKINLLNLHVQLILIFPEFLSRSDEIDRLRAHLSNVFTYIEYISASFSGSGFGLSRFTLFGGRRFRLAWRLSLRLAR